MVNDHLTSCEHHAICKELAAQPEVDPSCENTYQPKPSNLLYTLVYRVSKLLSKQTQFTTVNEQPARDNLH